MFTKRSLKTIIDWDLFASLDGFGDDTFMDNIDDKYDLLVEHLHDYTRQAKSFKTPKIRLSPVTLEPIRQRGAARPVGQRKHGHVRARKALQRSHKRRREREKSRLVG
ncbi:hypothetical protein RB195_024332 [Necator americanus]